MAAEVRELISGLEQTLARYGLVNIDDADELLNSQSQLAIMVADLHRHGQIPKDEAMQLIERLTTRIYESILRRERIDMRLRAQKAGIECLTTDTYGSKTAKMLAETGIPWATGEASRGLAVAVVHSDIGIAGSNRNTVTVADYLRFFELSLDDSQLAERTSSGPFLDGLVTPDGLITIAHETVSEALDEFSLISPDRSLPRSGSVIMLTGLDFLRKDQFSLINDAVENTIRTHPTVINHGTIRQNLRVDVDYALGQCAGIIYGGKTHPDPNLSLPSFYNLRSP